MKLCLCLGRIPKAIQVFKSDIWKISKGSAVFPYLMIFQSSEAPTPTAVLSTFKNYLLMKNKRDFEWWLSINAMRSISESYFNTTVHCSPEMVVTIQKKWTRPDCTCIVGLFFQLYQETDVHR